MSVANVPDEVQADRKSSRRGCCRVYRSWCRPDLRRLAVLNLLLAGGVGITSRSVVTTVGAGRFGLTSLMNKQAFTATIVPRSRHTGRRLRASTWTRPGLLNSAFNTYACPKPTGSAHARKQHCLEKDLEYVDVVVRQNLGALVVINGVCCASMRAGYGGDAKSSTTTLRSCRRHPVLPSQLRLPGWHVPLFKVIGPGSWSSRPGPMKGGLAVFVVCVEVLEMLVEPPHVQKCLVLHI